MYHAPKLVVKLSFRRVWRPCGLERLVVLFRRFRTSALFVNQVALAEVSLLRTSAAEFSLRSFRNRKRFQNGYGWGFAWPLHELPQSGQKLTLRWFQQQDELQERRPRCLQAEA